MTDSTRWSQPSLLDSRPPVRVRYEALIDPDDCTVVLVVECTTFPGKQLVSLYSTAPVGYLEIDAVAREAGREFTRIMRDHTGPF